MSAVDDGLRAALLVVASAPRLLVAVDFDGTLAPIVEDPAAAVGDPGAMRSLVRLSELPATEVAVVSGRARDDLAVLTRLPAAVRLVGSHGVELHGVPSLDDDTEALRLRMVDEVARRTDAVPGVLLEPKPAGVAVHVRRASREDAAAVLTDLRTEPGAWAGVHLTEGKEILELSVARGDKGDALDALSAEARADAVVFLGDDVTDEAAFARLRGSDVGVKVGPGTTAARFRLSADTEVPAVLALLADERSAHSARNPLG